MKDILASRRAILGGVATAAVFTLIPVQALAKGPESLVNTEESPKDLEASKPRFLHTATALQDGRILVVGGYHTDPATRERFATSPSTSVEIYDPSSDTWTDAAPLNKARARHAAALLPDGRVVVSGGVMVNELDSVEIYDPRTNSWSFGPTLPSPISDHTMCASGSSVIISGGRTGKTLISHPILASTTKLAP